MSYKCSHLLISALKDPYDRVHSQIILPFTGVINYLRSVYEATLLLVLERTKIFACMPENQPHGGDAHTADCQLRRVYYHSLKQIHLQFSPRDRNRRRGQIIQSSPSLESQRKPERFHEHSIYDH